MCATIIVFKFFYRFLSWPDLNWCTFAKFDNSSRIRFATVIFLVWWWLIWQNFTPLLESRNTEAYLTEGEISGENHFIKIHYREYTGRYDVGISSNRMDLLPKHFIETKEFVIDDKTRVTILGIRLDETSK